LAGKKEQKDNSTLALKISLRRNLLKEVETPVIMETHGGYGKIFELCYADLLAGVVFEKDPEKAGYLAGQRPTWAVYEGDCLKGIAARLGSHLPINFLDLDPYGSPWEIIEAFFDHWGSFPERLAVAINDGLRQHAKMKLSWQTPVMAGKVQKYGNNAIYLNYKEICQEMLEEKAAQAGYRLSRWTAYYCGFREQMTHYGAILERT
jgi:hypothetical protein